MFAEIGGSNGAGAFRWRDDLILVPGIEAQCLTAVKCVVDGSDGPASFEQLDMPAERLSHDLVAKADADQRDFGGVNVPDEIFERRNEG